MSQHRTEQLVASALHCLTHLTIRREIVVLLKQMGANVPPAAAAQMRNPQITVLQVGNNTVLIRISCVYSVLLVSPATQ